MHTGNTSTAEYLHETDAPDHTCVQVCTHLCAGSPMLKSTCPEIIFPQLRFNNFEHFCFIIAFKIMENSTEKLHKRIFGSNGKPSLIFVTLSIVTNLKIIEHALDIFDNKFLTYQITQKRTFNATNV